MPTMCFSIGGKASKEVLDVLKKNILIHDTKRKNRMAYEKLIKSFKHPVNYEEELLTKDDDYIKLALETFNINQ